MNLMNELTQELMIQDNQCTCHEECKTDYSDRTNRQMLYRDEAWHNWTMRKRAESLMQLMYNIIHDNTSLVIYLNDEFHHIVYLICWDCWDYQLIICDEIDALDLLESMMEEN